MSSLVTFVIGIDTFISRRGKIVPISKRYGCLRFLPHDATQSTLLPEQVVRPSVTFRYRGHMGWNSSTIISWLISLGVHSLQTPSSQI